LQNPRQLALEVVGVLLAVAEMAQQAIDVMKDGPLVDLLVLAVVAELFHYPIGDALAVVAPIPKGSPWELALEGI
jgi:hypothetical protein